MISVCSSSSIPLLPKWKRSAALYQQTRRVPISPVEKKRLWDVFTDDQLTLSISICSTTDDIYRSAGVARAAIVKTERRHANCTTSGSGTDDADPFHRFVKEFDLCMYCDAVMAIMDEGFPTCMNVECGAINKEALDYSPEWRFYGSDDKNPNDPTRCGNPVNPLLVESSFGCRVMSTVRSSFEMKKIRKWTEWQSMPHREKSLYDEFQFITIMAQNAGIPRIFIDDAMTIHKDISEQKMFRGINRDGIKAASIYLSCRLNECPRTAHEIADIFKLEKASATTGCSMAVNILHNIERNVEPSKQTELGMTTPSVFIERYASRLGMSREMTMLSMFVSKKVETQNIITDNTPHSIAAGILFFVSHVCNQRISKADVRTACGVSEVTVNKCFKKLDSVRAQLIPASFLVTNNQLTN